ncbi:MAG: Crp/Fnr family transcriptional regulator [Clostridiales bacterium]|nr:Crp/Fnr family transcriptional regulator [Candidatus Cacconaster stercorequi]
MVELEEKRFKKGEIIYKSGELDANMYNIFLGRAAVYMDYGTPAQQLILEVEEGDFLNIISFLEARPRNTTAVALQNTVVGVITTENFGKFFQEHPAKIMSLLQHMSARIRHLQKAYLETSQALEDYADTDRLKKENGEWYAQHNSLYRSLSSLLGHR